jgi:hypothetical protein
MAAFRDNAAEHRFELETAEGVVFAAYRDRQGSRAITHVETPMHARGKGHAGALMDAIVFYARAQAIKLTPLCSYAAAYFERTPSARDVLAE